MLQDLRAMLTLPATVKREQSLSLEAQVKTQGREEGTAGAYAFLTHTPAAQALGLNAALQNSTTAATATTTTTPGPGKANPLSTNTEFALAQLPALKALLSELRPKIAAMSHDARHYVKEGEKQRERRLYVESQTRNVLERRGVSIEESGVEPLGRRIGSEELMALEGIVDDLARGDGGVGESADD